jgi:cyclic-di-AMP phosphodiesterase PgpH
MKIYLQILKKSSRLIYRLIIFGGTAFLLQLILPGEPVFKFEYQKGSPWKHEDLIAPYDFAIQKTDAEIEKEKDGLTKNLPPYFKLDTTVFAKENALFHTDFFAIFDSTKNLNNLIFRRLSSAFNQVYSTGIITRSIDTYDVLKGKQEIARVIGNISTKIPIEKIYSEKTAYTYFLQLKNQIQADNPETADKLSKIDFTKYLKPNLVLDQLTTQSQIDEAESGISTSSGMIQAGEKIIMKGEIVDAQKFKILESLRVAYEKSRGELVDKYMIFSGKLIFVSVLLILLYIYMFFYRKELLNQFRRLIFLLGLMVAMVFISVVTNKNQSASIYLVPLAILPIVIRTFYDSRTAIFTLIVSTLIVGMYAPNSFEYVLIEITAGMVAVFSLARMYRRVHIVMASIWVLATNIIVFAALNTIREGNIANINFRMFQWFAGSCLLINLAYPLIYIFEKLFGFVSDVTLIEISETNQPLLRKLADEAPGTFQHSLQIANLAEEVIRKIGGNPFLVRAGALYHDIGKIQNAHYFTENQFGIKNPHDSISYEQSAAKIIEHVKDGLKVAKKYKLPDSLNEFISTHHGTTKAKYFYLKQKEEHPESIINDKKYEYPGPLPRSKEAAVVMLIDGIEAASRSLDDKNPENIKALVERMVDQKVQEHQLDNSKMTFNDIRNTKEILVNKLLNIYHVRITYPSEAKKI